MIHRTAHGWFDLFASLTLLDRIEMLEARIRGDVADLIEMKTRYAREYAEAECADGRANDLDEKED